MPAVKAPFWAPTLIVVIELTGVASAFPPGTKKPVKTPAKTKDIVNNTLSPMTIFPLLETTAFIIYSAMFL